MGPLSVHDVMIRAFLILLKDKSLFSLSDTRLLSLLTREALSSPGPCPSCGCRSPFYHRMAPYSRQMITVRNGSRMEADIRIPRLRCSCCGVSHAVLPEVLIPFGSYTVRFVLTVLYEYLHRSCRVADLCDRWQISISTLYSWMRLFTTHFSICSGIMHRIRCVCNSALQRVSCDPSFLEEFYNTFRFSFLQLRRRASRSPQSG